MCHHSAVWNICHIFWLVVATTGSWVFLWHPVAACSSAVTVNWCWRFGDWQGCYTEIREKFMSHITAVFIILAVTALLIVSSHLLFPSITHTRRFCVSENDNKNVLHFVDEMKTKTKLEEASSQKSVITNAGDVFSRWLADWLQTFHTRKNQQSGHCSGQNPVQLTYAVSFSIAIHLKTNADLFFVPYNLDFYLLTPK